MKEHLCYSCFFQFPTCHAKNIVWGIDKNPKAKGADADMVLECDAYEPTTQRHNQKRNEL